MFSSLKLSSAEYGASVEEARALMAELRQGGSDALELMKSPFLIPLAGFIPLMVTLRGGATHGLAHRDFCCGSGSNRRAARRSPKE